VIEIYAVMSVMKFLLHLFKQYKLTVHDRSLLDELSVSKLSHVCIRNIFSCITRIQPDLFSCCSYVFHRLKDDEDQEDIFAAGVNAESISVADLSYTINNVATAITLLVYYVEITIVVKTFILKKKDKTFYASIKT